MIYLDIFLEMFVFDFTILTAQAGERLRVDCCVVCFVKAIRWSDMG